MDEQTEAMIGLGTLTACADMDLEDEEVEMIVAIGMAILDDENTDSDAVLHEVTDTVAKVVVNFNRGLQTEDADDRVNHIINCLKTEAEKITDSEIRFNAIHFCMLVAEADSEVEQQEAVYMNCMHDVWAGMNDGWDLSYTEVIEKVMDRRTA